MALLTLKKTVLCLALASGACQRSTTPPRSPAPKPSIAAATRPATPHVAGEHDADEKSRNAARLAEFFEHSFQAELERQPMLQSELGLKTDYDRWDDVSDKAAVEELAIMKAELAELRRSFSTALLDDESRLSYRLFEYRALRELDGERFRHHHYVITHLHGMHTTVPSFLANVHRVDTVADAEAYVRRLLGVKLLFEQVIETMKIRSAHGIVPPTFVFGPAIEQCQNLLKGAPFDKSAKVNPLFDDFSTKVAALTSAPPDVKKRLLADARSALLTSVGPAYRSLIAALEVEKKKSTTDDGAWKFPDGQAFYAYALKETTTTNLSAAEIHQTGLREVARLHEEMRKIMQQVGFTGDLPAFFEFMQTDKRFYDTNDAAGRKTYLNRAVKFIDTMRGKLDSLFITKPKAPIVVKAVEEYRAKSAGMAFYERGTADGTRPGIFYANLYDMTTMPTYALESLAYHEGIPGHHMQLSIAQEMRGLPKFRQHSGYSAYVEGWGLYSELIPKELGLYEDPYSDFGRLAAELWRAVRLVVDTGIHEYHWDRKKAVEYIATTTPNGRRQAEAAADRYVVWPSQATAYKIGMNKILELRQHARTALGPRFDLRKFHDVVLSAGPLPLDLLEERVKAWEEGRL